MKSKKVSSYLFQFLLLILSILFFFLANPNILFKNGIGVFGFIVYLPVLLLINYSTLKENIIFGFIYGFVSYLLYAFWLRTFDSVCLWAACIVYAFILCAVFVVLKTSEKLFHKNGWIFQWLCLCSYEYLKTLGFLGFSYGVTAYTQWQHIKLIQICDVIGVYGLNAFLILFSVVLYSIIKHSSKFTYILFSVWVVLFISFEVYGVKQEKKFLDNKMIKVAAIQSNETPWKAGVEEYTKDVHKLMELTNEALELNPDIEIVVWPETAVVPAIVYQYETKKDERRYLLVKTLLEYIDSKDCIFVIGNGHEVNSLKSIHDVYNSALVFEPGKNVIPPTPDFYSKIKLVPFTETFPYKKTFPNFYRKLKQQNKHMWTAGREIKVFKKNGIYFSTPICFEDTFPTITRKMAQKGAKCFINLSNDSWSKSEICQKQHLAMAVFRSVESKVPSVRSTTSGQTCIIMPSGKIIAECTPFLPSYAVGSIPFIPQYEENTIYTKIGDVFGVIPIIVFLFLLIIRGLFVIISKSNK